MKIKKPIMYLIAIAIMGLLITSASSLPMQKTSSQEDEIKAEYLVVQRQPMLKTKNVGAPMHPLFSGVPITGGDYDEFHPSVAGSPAGGFYAMTEQTEDGSIYQIWLYGSSDGVVWDPILSTTTMNNAQFTDMDQNVYGTYGTSGASPDNSGQILILQGEIEDGWIWDFGSYNMNEFSNNHIACYTFEGPEGDPGTWNWGGISFTGYNGYGTNNIDGCPYIFYQSSSEGSGIIGWLTGAVSGCQNVGSTIDSATNIMYSVYDRYTGTEWELLIRKDNFGKWQYNSAGGYWTHAYMTSYHVNSTADLRYPSIAAYDNNVIVACQKGSDVVVFYSTNGFSSKTEVLVETSASYPEIVMAAQGKPVLTYIKDNVLYYRTSNDEGATWSDAEVVSDNQVNLNNRAANLDESSGNVYGVWEDTRGANIDAFFDIVYEYENTPPNTPTINGPTKVGKDVPQTYTFNTTDPDGDDVYYFVDWGDGTNTGWITQTTANHTWTKKGTYPVTCKAKDVYNAESGVATIQVKVPRSKSMNNLLYQIFARYPNVFPILRLILGY